MGFWKKIGNSLKEAGKNLADEIATRQESSQIKNNLLNRFEMKDLKKICFDYGIGEPSPESYDFTTGKKIKLSLTRDHYAGRIKRMLDLEQIKNFCDKNRIKTWDLIEGKKKVPMTEIEDIRIETPQKTKEPIIPLQKKFDSILDQIENHFELERAKDEEDFEKQLFQFLKAKYPDKNIVRQVSSPKGQIDLLIDNCYAIELKIADKKQTLSNLIGQVIRYKQVYDNLAIILLDIKRLSPHEIEEFIEQYAKFGAKTTVLNGAIKRRNRSRKLNKMYSIFL